MNEPKTLGALLKENKITFDSEGPISIDKKKVYLEFKRLYSIVNKQTFKESEIMQENLKPLFQYFFRLPEFFEHPQVIKEVDGDKLTLSFNKGLLLIGNYGNGKSSVMLTFEEMFKRTFLSFKYHYAIDVTEEFESLEKPKDKEMFWKYISTGRKLFDDVLTEDLASNYGVKNLFDLIIRKRCNNYDAKTFMIINFDPKDNNNTVEKALDMFGIKYSPQAYDRLFKLFNIVIFNGKSFRKQTT